MGKEDPRCRPLGQCRPSFSPPGPFEGPAGLAKPLALANRRFPLREPVGRPLHHHEVRAAKLVRAAELVRVAKLKLVRVAKLRRVSPRHSDLGLEP